MPAPAACGGLRVSRPDRAYGAGRLPRTGSLQTPAAAPRASALDEMTIVCRSPGSIDIAAEKARLEKEDRSASPARSRRSTRSSATRSSWNARRRRWSPSCASAGPVTRRRGRRYARAGDVGRLRLGAAIRKQNSENHLAPAGRGRGPPRSGGKVRRRRAERAFWARDLTAPPPSPDNFVAFVTVSPSWGEGFSATRLIRGRRFQGMNALRAQPPIRLRRPHYPDHRPRNHRLRSPGTRRCCRAALPNIMRRTASCTACRTGSPMKGTWEVRGDTFCTALDGDPAVCSQGRPRRRYALLEPRRRKEDQPGEHDPARQSKKSEMIAGEVSCPSSRECRKAG